MRSITRDEAKLLGRRAAQPIKAPGELLAVFVPGPLRNPSNGSYVHWSKHRKWAKDWKERVALAVFEQRTVTMMTPPAAGTSVVLTRPLILPHAPKRVAFLANVHTLFDDDNLRSALKPVRDGLVDCGVIHGDGPKDGHVFIYEQRVDRQHRGVVIRVSLR